MDIIFIIGALLIMLIGIVGSLVPIIPGVLVSWIGLVVFYLAPSLEFDTLFITITGIVALILYILDYIIPAVGTKKFGGSKAGMWGTTIGLIVGIFTPIPFGILIGPFLGALLGELVFNKTEKSLALKAAFGSFLGFIGSTFIKFVATLIYLGLFIFKIIEYWEVLFA